MDPPSGHDRARPKRGDGIWGFLFLLAGLPATFSALVFPFNPSGALPWIAMSWPPTILAGYRIWRGRNPRGDAGHEIAVRVQGAIGLVATALGVALVSQYPQIAALILGIFLALIVLLAVALWSVERRPAK